MNNKGDCPDAQAGLCLCCLQTPKAGFFVSRPIYQCNLYYIFLECIGSVVECLTRDQGAPGLSLNGVTALCP